MSHRKYIAPRHGSLRFLPRKRARRHRGRIRSFPPDNASDEPHLTAFMGYKAGMTHIMRQLNKLGSKAHQKDIVEAVTIIETPPMSIVGIVGYVKTPSGLRSIATAWASQVDDSFRRRLYKNWTRSKKKAFTNVQQKYANAESGDVPNEFKRRIEFIKRYGDIVRIIAHTQVKKLKNLGLKKAHIMEIQINGGDVGKKIEFAQKLLEQEVRIDTVFNQNELIDTIGVTRGHGWKGVVNRWGVTRLPRKTHRGLRKVACIGAWHPARVQYSVARQGQKGYAHRTEIHKKIYKIGQEIKYDDQGNPTIFNCSTDVDLTQKNITPMGGFVGYGVVKQDFIMIKGTCQGPRKRPITLRKSIVTPSSSAAKEEIKLKFIDTASKYGHGRFQTSAEKKTWFGPSKKDKLKEAKDKVSKQDQSDKYLSKSERKRRKKGSPKGSKKKGSKKKDKTKKQKTERKE